jgi:Domain of unknown function (DUF4390)
MDSITQFWNGRLSSIIKPKIKFIGFFPICLLILGLAQGALAEGISVRSVDLESVEEGYLLNADFDVELTPKLQDAVSHGVPLNFVLTFDLWRPRAWWFDETIIHFQEYRRLSFVPVTRMYRLNMGSTYETFPNLKDALKALSHVHAVPAAEKQALLKGQRYEASISLGLDSSLLPKPLQIEGLSTGEWQLSSPIHRFTVTP